MKIRTVFLVFTGLLLVRSVVLRSLRTGLRATLCLLCLLVHGLECLIECLFIAVGV